MNASDVLNRLTHHRRSQEGLMKYVMENRELLGQKINHCGSWLHLREWLESAESRLINANFCKKFLLCRSCAARRSGRLVEAYHGKVAQLQVERPELIPAMITLTVRNGDDLPERIAHLKAAWKKLMASRRKGLSASSRNSAGEFCKVAGGVRSLEVTKRETGWHPHFHVFALLSSYIDQPALSDEWLKITGDSFVVGVTKCKNGVLPGLIETLKYASKLSELAPPDALEIHDTLQGGRGTDPIGCLRGVSEPDIDQDDTEGLTGPYRDFIAMWLFGEKRYAMAPIEKSLLIERPDRCN